MNNKLLTGHHLECLSLKGGCTGSSESFHVKMSHCWKSLAAAQLLDLLDFSHIRVPTNSVNHGKPGKSPKIIPCMEQSWNLKKPE